MLGNVLGPRREVLAEPNEPGRSVIDRHVQASSSVAEPVEYYLYRPARIGWLRLRAQAKRLQSGRLDAYVGYMLIVLLVLLAVVAVIG